MFKLGSCRSVLVFLSTSGALGLALSSPAHGQIPYQEQEVRIHHLPSLMAVSHEPSYVLLTSLDTILDDKDICCGKDSRWKTA